ncbi:MAG: HAD-IC family P-type ATPase [Actinomycetota bacterium]|nr:HAD-IC family P-type ATPase [Actinomycetota bacterium]
MDARKGLSAAEAARRLEQDGPNRLAEARRERRWKAFLRQFKDLLIVILLVAAVVSLLVTREWETPVVIALVVLLNATIGFVQESRAEASLEALKKMLVTTAAVRRDGQMVRLDATELVAGDVVAVQAGDRVPADGRLVASTGLEVQESSLTGEAQPVAKSATAQIDPAAPLGDRTTVVFMNTMITRGHAELVVTATGMRTEIGRIAGMLHEAEPEPTPLQRQIADLSRTLALIAGAVIVVVFVLGLVRGQDFAELFISAVSLAVAAIPEGLPAVVAFTLAMGTTRLARRGAIVKRLASVETLGSTSQICTDKTGTLTLNQMTARELRFANRRFTVSGEGYSTEGRIRSTDGAPPPGTVQEALVAMALCTDSELRDGEMIGDPTEGALLVLAEKAGIDVAALRRERPRVREVPFDSDYKFMATFHRWTDGAGRDVVRCFIKGAPDVLGGRADRYLGGTQIAPLDDAARQRYAWTNAELAEQGMRVLAVGAEDFAIDDVETVNDPKDLLDRVDAPMDVKPLRLA